MTKKNLYLMVYTYGIGYEKEKAMDILNTWNENRGASESEMVYDLERTEDCVSLVRLYGSEKFFKVVDRYNRESKRFRFYLGGSNFEEPRLIDDITSMLEDKMDDITKDFIKSPETYAKVFVLGSIIRDMYNSLPEE